MSCCETHGSVVTLAVMSSPLAWQGDGPPQTLSPSLPPHYSDQFDASHSLASLTFIAAQLSTLLHTITLASSVASPTASILSSPSLSTPSPHSPSSTVLPLSKSLTLCHSNLISALLHVLSTSSQLLTLPTLLTPLPSLQASPAAPQPSSNPSLSSSTSTPPTFPTPLSISVPPRFTIRLVTDLEPVTPSASRPHSPCSSSSSPSSALSFPTHSPLPAAAVSVCDEAAVLSSVATNSTLTARSDSPASRPLVDSSSTSSCTLTTSTTIITASTAATTSSTPPAVADTPVAGPAQPTPHTHTTHPHTRSTSAPVHAFFVDLHTRTSKAAKHFRRLYTPTATICECERFPVYSQQIRSPTSPAIVLPAVLQLLCLECIADVVMEYRTFKKDKSGKPWLQIPVPGLDEQMWTKSMEDTLAACYEPYHAADSLFPDAPFEQFAAALSWVEEQQLQVWDARCTVQRAITEIAEDGEKQRLREMELRAEVAAAALKMKLDLRAIRVAKRGEKQVKREEAVIVAIAARGEKAVVPRATA